MGRLIHRLALERGFEVPLIVNTHDEMQALSEAELKTAADVSIEFTRPEAAVANLRKLLQAGIPVVTGTTGWYGEAEQLKQLCNKLNGRIIAATNFSPGVNMLFALNRKLAAMMQQFPEYTPQITDIHHIHKLDAPSGTALSLAEGIRPFQLPDAEIPIHSERTGEVPGTHQVSWKSPQDEVRIYHEAFGREGFASGALFAAQWIQEQEPGWYSAGDLYAFLQ